MVLCPADDDPLTEAPELLIMLKEAIFTLPEPLAKVTVAIWPLPERDLVLMMAILMLPGLLVLAAISAPEIRLPWVTLGDDSEPS